MSSCLLAAAILLIGAATAFPAAASCIDEIAALEDRLSNLKGDEQREEQVSRDITEGEVEVEAETAGEEPAESWFTTPQSKEGAKEQLDNARALAEDGEEEGCLEQLQQAERMLSALEG